MYRTLPWLQMLLQNKFKTFSSANLKNPKSQKLRPSLRRCLKTTKFSFEFKQIADKKQSLKLLLFSHSSIFLLPNIRDLLRKELKALLISEDFTLSQIRNLCRKYLKPENMIAATQIKTPQFLKTYKLKLKVRFIEEPQIFYYEVPASEKPLQSMREYHEGKLDRLIQKILEDPQRATPRALKSMDKMEKERKWSKLMPKL